MAPRRKKTNSKANSTFSYSSSINFTSIPASSPLQKVDYVQIFEDKCKEYVNKVEKEIADEKEKIISSVFKREVQSIKINVGPIIGNMAIPYDAWREDMDFESLYDELVNKPDENNTSMASETIRTPDTLHSPVQAPQTVFRKPLLKTATKTAANLPQLSTPANQGFPAGSSYSIASVTPGPLIQRPFSIMRKPMQGEVAISLSGSPLMVATDVEVNSLPQVNVPLQDGKVMSILPRDGLEDYQLPSLNESTKRQLTVLRSYIDRFLENKGSS